ncbi:MULTISPECIES: YqaE/Pmp3 family membrane protein [Shewanella]|uniref:YqaE/Pmp3 family membrane protein n=1 Tax=Shewanella TaxID=22 RepID=UPI001BB9C911|nr:MULTISPECIES: YqaE/Pmp3 family membrane protein [Shewanella]GIU52454.1 Pmp3 family protein [Shewanella sp. KT0246]
MDTNKLLLIVIAILLPPVAVFLKKGMGKDLLINIILCLLFFVPGLIHAIWVVVQD